MSRKKTSPPPPPPDQPKADAPREYPPAPVLTSGQRRFLRAQGHHLSPLVMVGKHGITDALISQADQVLLDHELIKVKVLEAAELETDAAGVQLADRLDAALVQTIGHLVVLYRPHPETPRLNFPKPPKIRPAQ